MIPSETAIKWNYSLNMHEKEANPPCERWTVCISGVSWKAAWVGISPARHSLSDRRINSSHGNSIFIFQGQRFSFFPSSPESREYFLGRRSSVWLWKKKEGKWALWRWGDAVYNKPSGERERGKKRKNMLELVENRWAINNSFNQISRAKIPCRRAS